MGHGDRTPSPNTRRDARAHSPWTAPRARKKNRSLTVDHLPDVQENEPTSFNSITEKQGVDRCLTCLTSQQQDFRAWGPATGHCNAPELLANQNCTPLLERTGMAAALWPASAVLSQASASDQLFAIPALHVHDELDARMLKCQSSFGRGRAGQPGKRMGRPRGLASSFPSGTALQGLPAAWAVPDAQHAGDVQPADTQPSGSHYFSFGWPAVTTAADQPAAPPLAPRPGEHLAAASEQPALPESVPSAAVCSAGNSQAPGTIAPLFDSQTRRAAKAGDVSAGIRLDSIAPTVLPVCWPAAARKEQLVSPASVLAASQLSCGTTVPSVPSGESLLCPGDSMLHPLSQHGVASSSIAESVDGRASIEKELLPVMGLGHSMRDSQPCTLGTDAASRAMDVVAWLGQLPADHSPLAAPVPMLVSPMPCSRPASAPARPCHTPFITPGLSLPADNEVEDPLKPLQSPAAEPGCNDWQLAFSPFSDRSRETATDSSHEGGCSMADSTAMGASAGKSSTGGMTHMSEDVGEFWEKGVARRRGSQAPMKPKGTPPGAGTLHHVTHFNQRMQQALEDDEDMLPAHAWDSTADKHGLPDMSQLASLMQ